MKLYDPTILMVVGVVVVAGIVGWLSAKKLGDDNPVEQFAEEVMDNAVEYETGINPHIDLTPNSPEIREAKPEDKKDAIQKS